MANNVPVKSIQDKNLKVASQRNLAHVADQHIAAVNALEFSQASTSYPIVFIKEPESTVYRSVVMLGLEANENLFYKEDKWDAIYVPQNLSMVPFSLGLDPEKEKTLTTCIDLDSPFVGEDKDNALFDADGNETDFYKGAQESLGRMYESEVMTDKFIKELEENDLLLELELNITFNNNQTKKLVGLFGINEQKLVELSDEKVLDFHKRGLFIPIHAMLGSAAQINRLAQLRNQSNAELKIAGIKLTPVVAEEKK